MLVSILNERDGRVVGVYLNAPEVLDKSQLFRVTRVVSVFSKSCLVSVCAVIVPS